MQIYGHAKIIIQFKCTKWEYAEQVHTLLPILAYPPVYVGVGMFLVYPSAELKATMSYEAIEQGLAGIKLIIIMVVGAGLVRNNNIFYIGIINVKWQLYFTMDLCWGWW